jgi:predicted CoA-binding protein
MSEVARADGPWAEPAVIRSLLQETTVWAVVGLRDNPARPAWGVARWLQGRGKQVMPIHPLAEEVHGATGYPTLADVPFPVDVVDLFVRSERVGALVDQAVDIGAGAVWLQLGVVDEAAAARASAAGLAVVMDRCPAIEGAPYLGG